MSKDSLDRVLVNLVKSWKKPIIIVGLGLSLCLVLVIGAAGYAAFSLGSALWSKGSETVKTIAASEPIPELPSPQTVLSGVQGFGLELSKGWLLQKASDGQFQVMWKGISCLEAVGGPGHEQVEAYLGPLMNEKLRSEMSKTFDAGTESSSTWGSCVNLILQS